jgi:hypothetical protein
MLKKIVIADRGWIFLGDVYVDTNGNILISDAKVIRNWGTTMGLGQIALTGPTSKTILDDAGTVRIPVRSVIAVLDCKW